MLELIISRKITGKEIFSIMLKKLSPEKVLAFLGNESSFKDDIKIMNSLPKTPFLIAGLKQLIKPQTNEPIKWQRTELKNNSYIYQFRTLVF